MRDKTIRQQAYDGAIYFTIFMVTGYATKLWMDKRMGTDDKSA